MENKTKPLRLVAKVAVQPFITQHRVLVATRETTVGECMDWLSNLPGKVTSYQFCIASDGFATPGLIPEDEAGESL